MNDPKRRPTAGLAYGTIPAMDDVTAGSQFVRSKKAGLVKKGVSYVNIVSRTSGVVSVADAKLPLVKGAKNIVLRVVMNELDPSHAKTPCCHVLLPFA